MAKDILLEKADRYAHLVYKLTKKLPRDEIFGLTSQLRRAALSVPLNIVEGHARQSTRSHAHFLSISFGSLKESQYLVEFAIVEGYLTPEDTQPLLELGQEIARMTWVKIKTLKSKLS